MCFIQARRQQCALCPALPLPCPSSQHCTLSTQLLTRHTWQAGKPASSLLAHPATVRSQFWLFRLCHDASHPGIGSSQTDQPQSHRSRPAVPAQHAARCAPAGAATPAHCTEQHQLRFSRWLPASECSLGSNSRTIVRLWCHDTARLPKRSIWSSLRGTAEADVLSAGRGLPPSSCSGGMDGSSPGPLAAPTGSSGTSLPSADTRRGPGGEAAGRPGECWPSPSAPEGAAAPPAATSKGEIAGLAASPPAAAWSVEPGGGAAASATGAAAAAAPPSSWSAAPAGATAASTGGLPSWPAASAVA